jgi:O-acetyl-ADP-ribose deacetylase (regulator of RNase III)
MVNYKKGNIFESGAGIIAHGVNCKGAFGSGVAGQIAKLYPKTKSDYLYKFQYRRLETWRSPIFTCL